jgi:hypothetical protein
MNRYAYTQGDPVNRVDRNGTVANDPFDPDCGADCFSDGGPSDDSSGCFWNAFLCPGYMSIYMGNYCASVGLVLDSTTESCVPAQPTGPFIPVASVTCVQALTQSIQSFLQTQDAPLLSWDPTLASDLATGAAKANIDPRLYAAIATFESGHGTTLSHNNPFGLQDATYTGPASAIRSETRTLAKFIRTYGENSVSKLYTYGADHYCQTSQTDCANAEQGIAGFLNSFAGNQAAGLRAGNENNLAYPCPQ